MEEFLPNSAVFKACYALSLFSLASVLNAVGGGGKAGYKNARVTQKGG